MATKNELQEQLDSAGEVLNEAYTPEATREDLAAAVGEALDILNGEDDSDESDDDDSDWTRTKTRGNSRPAVWASIGARKPGGH